MFDIGFWEIVVISVLGLLVLGPERLPVAIRTVSTWVKTIKGAANSVKEELSHELKIQEMHDNLKKAEQQGMNNISPDLQSSIDSLRDAAASVTRPYADDKSTPTSTPSVDQVPKVAEQVIEQDKK
ncbi:Sec-independent translocase [Moritella viscosa]|uniref:Sec-independent protein translocase protein TatB n=1 Tax=Moritella viscosa TaxID=80854 RepID=UPI000509163F|nr:Sec-independent protein translocase protein TatB [Moritella viscosa]CED58071.1 sec-independent protein translocase protein TatB [Moritella viscosa]SHO09361.1 Sec-independent translocase [Moritella viscosa]SHO22374.1 Sec-independent translocase [Moritella viscosa]